MARRRFPANEETRRLLEACADAGCDIQQHRKTSRWRISHPHRPGVVNISAFSGDRRAIKNNIP